jgi:hypothetical protein
MSILIEHLPPYEQISCEPVSQAAANWDAAKAALLEAKRSLVEAEQTLPSSEWKDAEAAEAARSAGKPEPKRTHTQEHERRVSDLAHEHRVCQLAADRARRELQVALDEHSDKWAAESASAVESLRSEYQHRRSRPLCLLTGAWARR